MNWVHYNTPLMIRISTSQQSRSSSNPLAGCELNLHFNFSVRLTYHLSAKIEETLLELRKSIEGVEGIETRKNAPSGFAACWKKDPIILEDALGRLLLIPLDIVVSWEVNINLKHLWTF
jgi:hypothetical protein